MNIIKYITNIYDNSSKILRIMYAVFYLTIVFLYFWSLVFLILAEASVFSDYDTLCYYAYESFSAANQVLSIFAILLIVIELTGINLINDTKSEQ